MHTMFKGSISFGLVNIPIKMFTATEEKDIHFKYLHKTCNTPVKYKKTCPTCNVDVNPDDIVRGYEYEPGRYVILKDEDFDAVSDQVGGRVIDIIDFIKLEEIDPIYYDKSYYLAPQEMGSSDKAYNLLRAAMDTTGKIAIAKITIRNKQTLAALRVYQSVLVLETLYYPDEVREVTLVPGLPEKTETVEKELDIAQKLIENLTAPFDPGKYKDDYRERLRVLIDQKIQGQDITVSPTIPEKSVVDLMEALQASLLETKKKTVKTAAVKTTKKTTAKAVKE